MLETRGAHGYCSRHIASKVFPYPNICEQCDNLLTNPAFLPAFGEYLHRSQALRDDANTRGWPSQAARHQRVILSFKDDIIRLGRQTWAPKY